MLPSLVALHLPRELRAKWVKFLAAEGPVPSQSLVRTGTAYLDRRCPLCALGADGAVANEQHVILECPDTAGVRQRYLGGFEWGLRDGGALKYLLIDNQNDPNIAHFVLSCLACYKEACAARGLDFALQALGV